LAFEIRSLNIPDKSLVSPYSRESDAQAPAKESCKLRSRLFNVSGPFFPDRTLLMRAILSVAYEKDRHCAIPTKRTNTRLNNTAQENMRSGVAAFPNRR
jgi:hypothetical protein